jgi:predicted lipoprotein with Yx(FWY)xxD motif
MAEMRRGKCNSGTGSFPISRVVDIERKFIMTALKTILCVIALGCFGVAHAVDNLGSAPIKIDKIDGLVTDLKGMTLYTFDKDTAGDGKSACNGPCAALWPPFAAGANEVAGVDFKVITREDGTKQWTYMGKPLYLYSKDMKPGDKTGNKFNNVWHEVHFSISH